MPKRFDETTLVSREHSLGQADRQFHDQSRPDDTAETANNVGALDATDII